MISVIIPTLDAEATLVGTLNSLVPAAMEGLVQQVIVVDGGSTDQTLQIADGCGADIVHCARGRGAQLAKGASLARGSWLLFLHADTVLSPGWERRVVEFMQAVDLGRRRLAAAAFRFELDDEGLAPRLVEHGVSARCVLFKMPYGDQGLLIPRSLYDEIGGYKPLELMEDVDIIRRLGRKRIVVLPVAAVTSAARYQQDGYASRVLRNWACLVLYTFGASITTVARIYTRKS